jgi:hypothetical protein
MKMTKFTNLDCGQQRQDLAQRLADWRTAGHISYEASTRFYRQVNILARRIKGTQQQIMADLRSDADALAAND